ncbi:MAG: signal peptide peptidase SppA [Succinivibrionaceae bacterium]|nr:signal peptide peptidase SppA [Succinivibrionaceae bacterium]
MSEQEPRERRSLLHGACVVAGLIGSALTFLRNLIGNTLMVLALGLILACIMAADDLAGKVGLGEGEPQPPAKAGPADPGMVYFCLDGTISERPFSGDRLERLNRELASRLSRRSEHELCAIEAALAQAADDEKVRAVHLDLTLTSGLTMAVASRLGKALDALRSRGKKAIAYAEYFDQGTYLIAAHCDEAYCDPLGEVGLSGIGIESLYYAGALRRFGLTPYVFRAGEFKSAVEPLLRDSMSEGVKAECQELADGLWGLYEREILAARQIKGPLLEPAPGLVARLRGHGGNLARMQQEQRLIDGALPYEELMARLAREYGADPEDEAWPLETDYRDYLRPARNSAKDAPRVAVIYGLGTITSYTERTSDFTDENLLEVIDSADLDEQVRAVVVYLDSPGGEALASEKIRRGLERLRAHGKKVVVSMNGTAASGAYLVAMGADRILATPSTITGSIGVFATMLGAHHLLNEYGVHQDGASTHEFAQAAIAAPLGEQAGAALQLSIDSFYRFFVDTVAAARHLDPQGFHDWAEGRVFLAGKAKGLGLIDGIGDFSDALAAAEELAGIGRGKAQVVTLHPSSADPLKELSSMFLGSTIGMMLPQKAQLAIARLTAILGDQGGSAPQPRLMAISPLQPRI